MRRTLFCKALSTALGALLMVGCSLFGPSRSAREADDTGKIRVACVGDSITYGAKIPNQPKHSYPSQLGELLGEGWEVGNFGAIGATLLKSGDHPYWSKWAFDLARGFKPDVVVIMLGTNDTTAQNWRHSAAFVHDYVELIRAFAKLKTKPRIWICYPVRLFPENPGIRKSMIREVLAKIDQVAAQTGTPVIDVYTPFNDRPELFSDGVHPNAAGARLMAETIYQALTERTSIDPSNHGAASPTRLRIRETTIGAASVVNKRSSDLVSRLAWNHSPCAAWLSSR